MSRRSPANESHSFFMPACTDGLCKDCCAAARKSSELSPGTGAGATLAQPAPSNIPKRSSFLIIKLKKLTEIYPRERYHQIPAHKRQRGCVTEIHGITLLHSAAASERRTQSHRTFWKDERTSLS